MAANQETFSTISQCRDMPVQISVLPSHCFPGCILFSFLTAILWLCLASPTFGAERVTPSSVQRLTVPILGTTLDQHWEQIGVVAEVNIQLERRRDHDGLRVQFHTSPGRFSPGAQGAVQDAIAQVVKVSRLDPDSWTVTLTLPYQGLTMYGESLSGMVSLSVLALAKGDSFPRDRVLTGTITPTGHIGVVGGVPLKIEAAYQMHFRKVLIPEEIDVADGDWRTPFLMQVSPVGTIQKAYRALTGRSLEAGSALQTVSTLAAK